MKSISHLDLSELMSLTYEINSLIERDFSHVKHHIPDNLISGIKKYRELLLKERDRRECEL